MRPSSNTSPLVSPIDPDGAIARFQVDYRRQPAAEPRVEPGRIQADDGCRCGIHEAGGELAHALGVVDLHAVEDDQVVFGAGTPDGKLTVLVVGSSDARQYLQAM